MTSPLTRRALLRGGLAIPALGVLGACQPGPISRERSTVESAARHREASLVVDAVQVTDGAGVRLRRAIGANVLPMLDPFLLLDEFRSDRADDYIAGFPSHPHRGFETVTYMLEGAMEHRDSMGNEGRLGPGSAQWMTAGHGIVHSEMPKQVSGVMHGYQLWVNLPRAHKMIAPRYQDIAPSRIPTLEVDDARVRLVAGSIAGAVGPVEGIVTAPELVDVSVPRGGRFERALPTAHNAFAYVIDGEVRFGTKGVRAHRGQIVVLGAPGDRVRVASDEGGRILLAAAQPIGEPVARQGPFVMNTREEIDRAIYDYQTGVLTRM